MSAATQTNREDVTRRRARRARRRRGPCDATHVRCLGPPRAETESSPRVPRARAGYGAGSSQGRVSSVEGTRPRGGGQW